MPVIIVDGQVVRTDAAPVGGKEAYFHTTGGSRALDGSRQGPGSRPGDNGDEDFDADDDELTVASRQQSKSLSAFGRLLWSDAVRIARRYGTRKNVAAAALWYLGYTYSGAWWIVYCILSAILFMFLNTGKRKPGEASAYSIFNGGQRLLGQLTTEHFENEIRHRGPDDAAAAASAGTAPGPATAAGTGMVLGGGAAPEDTEDEYALPPFLTWHSSRRRYYCANRDLQRALRASLAEARAKARAEGTGAGVRHR